MFSQYILPLGDVILNPDLSFDEHIKTVSRTAFFHLRNIAKIRNFLSNNDAEKFIHSFVTSKLDYCNALLSGYPDKALNKLQLVLNTAARIVTRTKTFDNITPVLASLHWLPVKARALFKVLLLTYKALHGHIPTSLSNLVPSFIPTGTLRSKDTGLLTDPHSGGVIIPIKPRGGQTGKWFQLFFYHLFFPIGDFLETFQIRAWTQNPESLVAQLTLRCSALDQHTTLELFRVYTARSTPSLLQ